MTSRYQRTTKVLTSQGLFYEKTEHWNHYAKKRIDFLGIIDLIAFLPGKKTIGIQVCGDDFQAHVKKITIEKADNTKLWLSCPGNYLEIWAWRRLKKKRGGKAMYWAPRIADVLMINGELNWEERK